MSYLTPSTCLALGETLIEISRIETQVEVIRRMLCEQPRFHPYLAFKMVDTINQEKKGYLTDFDVKVFLELNGFQVDLTECRIYIKNYDQDNDGTLQYSEFLRSVFPVSDQLLRQEVSLKQPSQSLDQRSEYILAKLINAEIKLTLGLDNVKEQLHQCYDFTPTLCFKQIDVTGRGNVTLQDLQYFFFQNAIIVYDEEVAQIFRRIDILNDGLIDQDEMVRALTQNSRPNDPTYQSPMKSSHYLQRYLQKPKTSPFERSNTQTSENIGTHTRNAQSHIYDTPPKLDMSRNLSNVQSERRNKSKVKTYDFDETMSNVLTQSQINKTTKIVKKYESPLRQSQAQIQEYQKSRVDKRTPQKYIDQKMELRAQLQLSKISSKSPAKQVKRTPSKAVINNTTPLKSQQPQKTVTSSTITTKRKSVIPRQKLNM